jgi:hypothetical protein
MTLVSASTVSGECSERAGVVQSPVWSVPVEIGFLFGGDFVQVVSVHDEDPVHEFTAYAALWVPKIRPPAVTWAFWFGVQAPPGATGCRFVALRLVYLIFIRLIGAVALENSI